MSADWPVVRLGEYCLKVGSGATPKGGKSVYLDSGCIALIRSQNIYNDGFKSNGLAYITAQAAEKLSNVEVQSNDVLLNITGDSVARVCLAPNEHLPARVNQHVAIIRPDPKEFDARFLRYFLASPYQQELLLTIASAGATRNALTKSHIESLKVCKPDLQTQRRIADQLHALENKTQLNGSINQTLEKIAQAIFKSWFVDFEPVKAKIAAQERWLALQPTAESASPVCDAGEAEPLPDLDTAMNLAAMQAISGKDEAQLTRFQIEQPEQYAELFATAELFPAALQDSELGEIPEGWVVSQIGDEVAVVGGGTPSTKNAAFWDGGNIHWTSPKDLSGLADKVLIETERKITEAGLAKISSGLLPIDTVLMSSRAPVGYLALARIPVAVNQGYIAMICGNTLSPEFVLQWCNAYMEEIKSRASGTTFAEISKKNFRIIPVAVPPEEIVLSYSKTASQLYKSIESNLRESGALEETRDILLPRLLSGELSVPDSETQVSEPEAAAHV
ncbi:restriction endonuclease subunit S [Parahaliea mediterranea]|uniref:Restriction endonuclease subunit S n=1 Tax=Parahaliea mediterranea TaxID=651086 RepID=A0A939DGQ9_9GAMM|nr:restriction endonuclease subunit S [Parahaliea mediterranea]MBN7797871.1 restriction endonuclease subunit S [Parahaliea mediterranea]